jgi:HEAT repeat protein
VRSQAAHALPAVGAAADDVVASLVGILQDESVEVRLAGIDELAQLGAAAKAALPALTGATRDPRTAVREAATDAVKRSQAP